MKLKLEDDSLIEISTSDGKLILKFKTKKDERTTVIMSASLNAEQLNKLITGLVSSKLKVK